MSFGSICVSVTSDVVAGPPSLGLLSSASSDEVPDELAPSVALPNSPSSGSDSDFLRKFHHTAALIMCLTEIEYVVLTFLSSISSPSSTFSSCDPCACALPLRRHCLLLRCRRCRMMVLRTPCGTSSFSSSSPFGLLARKRNALHKAARAFRIHPGTHLKKKTTLTLRQAHQLAAIADGRVLQRSGIAIDGQLFQLPHQILAGYNVAKHDVHTAKEPTRKRAI